MEYLIFIKDVAFLIVTAFGVWVAYQGLRTWKKQLHGAKACELSEKILLKAYEYRNALELVVFPVFPTVPWDKESLAGMDKNKADAIRKMIVVGADCDPAYDTLGQLGVLALQAEATLGQEIEGHVLKLHKALLDIRTRVSLRARITEPQEMAGATPELNEFWERTLRVIKDIENALRLHMGKT